MDLISIINPFLGSLFSVLSIIITLVFTKHDGITLASSDNTETIQKKRNGKRAMKWIIVIFCAMGFAVGSIGGINEIIKYISLPYGQYEWQWAGENWKGDVIIMKTNEGKKIATITMNELHKAQQSTLLGEKGEYTIQPLFESNPNKESKVKGNKNGFTLTLPVRKITFDNQGKKQYTGEETLIADLQVVRAYAGKVTYQSKDLKTEGDIAIIGDAYSFK